MTEPRGASVVIVGGGVTGLSAGWWLARAGVDVLVLEAGIVGWEASGRNGGGATHVYSPLGPGGAAALAPDGRAPRLPDRAHAAPDQGGALGRAAGALPDQRRDRRAARLPDRAARPQRAPRARPDRRGQRHRRALPPLRRPREPAAHRAGVRVGAPGPGRPHPPAHAGHGLPDRRRPRHGRRDRRRAGRRRHGRPGGGAADGSPGRPPRRHGPARPVARRDDLHRAPAADAGRRGGRQRPLRAPDAPREPRLRRRAARVARRRLALGAGLHAPRRRSSGTSGAASRSSSPAPPTSASSGAGPGSWRTRRTGCPSSTAWPIRPTSCSPPCRASGSGSPRPPARPSASSSSTAGVASPTSRRSGGAASPTRPPTGAPGSGWTPAARPRASSHVPTPVEGDPVKAAVCYELGKPLVVEDVILDPPKAGEVRVRIGAVAICHSDVHLVRGDWLGWSSTPPPVVAGHEAAGLVDEIGPGVTGVRPGDRVVVSLLRTCGRCAPCLTGAAYLCEGTYALMTEHRLHTRAGQAAQRGDPGRGLRGSRGRGPVAAGGRCPPTSASTGRVSSPAASSRGRGRAQHGSAHAGQQRGRDRRRAASG